MAVLVTGVNGLVGAHVARILAENGHRVVGHDLNRSGELAFYPEVEKAITFVRGDVTQFTHLLEVVETHRVEGVIHLASLRNEVFYKALPTELMRVNLSAVQNIVELARLGKIRRIVLASTAAVYGKVADPEAPIFEDAPVSPVGLYANSKVMCECLLRCYRNVYGVESVVVRLSRVWGRLANLDTLEFGNPLSSFVSKAVQGVPICEPSGADFGGDFTYAPDAAMGFYRAYVTPRPAEWVYHIGPGRFYRLSEVADTLRRTVPGAQIALGPGMHPYVTQSPIRGPLDIGRAVRDLGYTVQYGLPEALEHFIATVRSVGGR
jgi:nucleoside-diphosphate-sugar epimerase